MKTLNDTSIKALISLLEDPSDVIYNEIYETIVALGSNGISPLQTALDESESDLQKERIAEILDRLKIDTLKKDLEDWSDFNREDLLTGLIIIAKYGHPNLDVKTIKDTISEIAETIKPEIEGKSQKEIIAIMNQIILYDFGFNGNIRNYSSINNSFINKVIENKVSNPIGLSIIYLLVAKQLNIPLIGINSPGHFILGFAIDDFMVENIVDGTIINNINFYVDPFQNGEVIQNEDFDKMLLEVPYKLEDKVYLPATNVAIIKRVMNNLIYALFTTGEKTTAQELLDINEAF